MTDKWMPEAGQECEFDMAGQTYTGQIKYVGDKHLVVQSGDEWVMYIENARPITTETDKYRDEQIEQIENIACGFLPTDLTRYAAKNLSVLLFENGCRIIAPDERIVKPLTDSQKRAVFEAHFKSVATSLELIDAVQRELGVID